MGRPAFSWKVTPGDHGTEGSEDPPTMVTAPSGAIPKQLARQIAVTPRGFVGPTLSRSSRRQHDRMKDCQTNIPRQRSRHQTKHKGGVDQNIDHTHYQCRGPLPGGADADGVGPNSPPIPAPEKLPSLAHQNRTIAIASDFRVDGAKSQEIPQKEGVLGSEVAPKSQIASDFPSHP